MTPRIIAGSAALALLLATGAARADVTPENVWTAWKSLAQGYGETISAASETRQGDTLVVKGVTLAMDQAGARASGGIDEIRFKDQGDGTVKITTSGSYKMQVETPKTPTQAPASVAMDIAMPGMSTIASGTPAAMDFAVTAPEVDLHAEAGASDPAKGGFRIDLAMTGNTGSYKLTTEGQDRTIDYKLDSKSAKVTSHVRDPANKTDATVNITIGDIAVNSTSTYPGGKKIDQLAAALDAGFKVNTDVKYGACSYEVDSVSSGIPAKVSGQVGSGEFGLALDKKHFQILAGSKAVTLALDSKAIPIPGLGGGFGEFAFNFMMPLEKSDKPAPFALMLKLADLKVSDAIWGMIDPSAALPHDPATVILDTKGTATLTADLTDKGAQQALGGKPPGMLNSFDVTELDVKAAGAEVTGAGSFTFDNSDLATFGGFPAPTGKLVLKAVGLIGLMDKLVSMGVMPQDQAMQSKMMLGMFATPGPAPDTLISTIEFKDKKLMINGMEMPTH